jgi:hypothetical protein
MKKTLLPLFLLVFSSLFAQEKVNFKKKKFFVPSIVYSEYPVLDNALTQTGLYQLDPELKMYEKKFKDKFFFIDGFIKEPENGKLRIYITIPTPKFKGTYLDSIYDKKSKKYYYELYSGYNVKINVDVKCADKLLSSDVFNLIEKEKIDGAFLAEDIKSIVENNNREKRKAELKSDFKDEDGGLFNSINKALSRIQSSLNYRLRYSTTTTKEKFEFMTSKGHPEYSQMLAFETEITAQLKNITLEKGFEEKKLTPHLAYLEGLLTKYPASDANTDIRFIITNNLAETYLLLENKDKALFYADLLIQNDKQEGKGRNIVNRVKLANFVDKKIRTHTNRFVDLQKLGYKMAEDKEEQRLAFFERIDQQESDWVQEKETRNGFLEKRKEQINGILDSISYQSNAEILNKVIANLGGSGALKKIEKTHIFSKLKIEESNMPQTEERWATTTNYLLKKKTPENYFHIVNGPEAWISESQQNALAPKWKTQSSSNYWDLAANLDPLFLLNSLQLDIWNNYETLPETMINGRLCFHFQFFEKKLNANNRTIPKTDYHLYIDKENFNIVASEKTEYEDGNKSFFERKTFLDYMVFPDLNNGKMPRKIYFEIEDFYGDTAFTEIREKIEINPTIANRIFIKEVYAGGFK